MRKRVSVVAAILKNTDNQILIVQRPLDKELGGYWEFPGGKVEIGEAPNFAIQRELKEELNIDIILADLEEFTRFSYPLAEKDLHFTFYLLKSWHGEIKLNEGQPQYVWVAPNRLDQYQMPAPNIKIHALLATL